ncbi:MAG TPA: VOC family protein [Caulobacteraceae bacterium]|jgi:uncharacterized glyoxalase superfamily protein PhnB|nr:VOC family protein [Caulobacteraceae bacterium]
MSIVLPAPKRQVTGQAAKHQQPRARICDVVEDGQAWFDRAVAAGCTVLTPFQQMFWGDKWGAVIDPYQIRWGIDEPAKS